MVALQWLALLAMVLSAVNGSLNELAQSIPDSQAQHHSNAVQLSQAPGKPTGD
jgi:hypothetical protein